MLSFLKNIIKPVPKLTPQKVLESSLVSTINSLLTNNNINNLVYTPVNKLYVINTYSSSFNDLTSNLYSPSLQRNLIAINLHSYFNNSTVDINTELKKVAEHIPMVKLHVVLEYDLYELCKAFESLLEMELKNV